MTFKEILQDVVSWISKEGSVSYRAIKRQYDEVDDDFGEVDDHGFAGRVSQP